MKNWIDWKNFQKRLTNLKLYDIMYVLLIGKPIRYCILLGVRWRTNI